MVRRLEPHRLADMNKTVTIPIEVRVPLHAWGRNQEEIGQVIDDELDVIMDQVWDAYTEGKREEFAVEHTDSDFPLELYARARRLPATATGYRGVAARYHTGAGKWKRRVVR